MEVLIEALAVVEIVVEGGDRGDRGRGRGRGRPRARKDEEEKWVPCTKLGRLVQQVTHRQQNRDCSKPANRLLNSHLFKLDNA